MIRPEPEPDTSVAEAIGFLKSMMAAHTAYTASTLTPDDPGIDRHDTGPWAGTWTDPIDLYPGLPYTPILLTGPLWLPVVAGKRVDFSGRVDAPFYSMDGWVGRRDIVNPSPPPPYITDPNSLYANGGTNWGRFFVVGSVGGKDQFIAPTAANATWFATVATAPPGSWSFQIVTYANAEDATADANRILVGYPWLERQRSGDVRKYYAASYTPGNSQFSGVTVGANGSGGVLVSGTLNAFTAEPGFTYQILATVETDVEYAWALQPVGAAGAFTIDKPYPMDGKLKLRLVEQQNGCTVRVVGKVWAEENAADASAVPDLRIEYRALTSGVPFVANAIVPAKLDHTWQVPLAGGGAVGRVALVDVNTRRVLGEHTMPTGLMRSFIVPPEGAGQDTTSVYYDGFLDTCFLYDQAVALIAFLQMGERDAAVKLVDALLTVQNADGSFPFSSQQGQLYEHNADFIRIGAVAWVCYALLLCASPAFVAWFPNWPGGAAQNCLGYILTYLNSIGTVNGGKGRYVGSELDPSYLVPWWSMEHNIDTWWCLDLAHQLYGSGTVNYSGIAATMKAALLTDGYGWDGSKGIFWQGGVVTAGNNAPDGMHALDTHSWGAILLQKWGRASDARVSLDRAARYYYVTDRPTGLSGYTTFIPLDGYPPETVKTPWYEGSFGVVLAQRGDTCEADALMSELKRAQRSDGSYLYALQADPVNDIKPWPCLIAPAWNVVAMSGDGTPNTRVLWPLT